MNPYGILAALVIAGALWLGHDLAATQGQLKLASLKLDHDQALIAAQARAAQRWRADAQDARDAEARAIATAAASDAQIDTLKRSLARAKQYRPAPAAPLEDRPRCVFTWGDVRLLNATAGVPASGGGPDGADPGLAAADGAPDESLDSGLTQGELFEWHADYAGRCRRIESRVNGLIDLTRKREARP